MNPFCVWDFSWVCWLQGPEWYVTLCLAVLIGVFGRNLTVLTEWDSKVFLFMAAFIQTFHHRLWRRITETDELDDRMNFMMDTSSLHILSGNIWRDSLTLWVLSGEQWSDWSFPAMSNYHSFCGVYTACYRKVKGWDVARLLQNSWMAECSNRTEKDPHLQGGRSETSQGLTPDAVENTKRIINESLIILLATQPLPFHSLTPLEKKSLMS